MDRTPEDQIAVFPGTSQPTPAPRPDPVQKYDFRNPVTLDEKQQRTLRQEHESYINSLGALLSIYLRLEVSLQVSQLELINFQKFASSVPNPAQLTLFKIEGLPGTAVLEISPRLGLTIVERLMGGPGQAVENSRDLTEIENALLDQVVQIILNEWCIHWTAKGKFKATIFGHETNPLYLRSSDPDTLMFVLGVEVSMCDCVEQIHLAFPFSAIQSLLSDGSPGAAVVAAPAGEPKFRWRDEYGEIEIPMKAEWRLNHLPAGRVARLHLGEVIELEPEIADQVLVRLSAVPKFTGKLGMQGARWAVQITGKQTKSV